MKVGYLGPVGTYCYEACSTYTSGKYEMQPYKTIRETITAVVLGQVDKCIVPIENSIEGSVNQTIDTILENDELTIEGELVLPINHYLLSVETLELKNVKQIYSHPQALAQCRKFISNNMIDAEIIETASTALAAKEIYRFPNSVAIANKACAEVYNLKIIKENIQDESTNQTRFILISLKSDQQRQYAKTSIIFSTLNSPGALYRVLGLFNLFEINLTKIESRPAKTKIGEYIFLVDFEGDKEEEHIKILLNHIKRACSYLRILGSYDMI
ncbi:MAG TPA: prephenate dehydratase [Clostridiales bacterium]|nr:MAG: hypothetical protein A2Y22_07960 [Clostridiales bacterium GWD2_32_59]HAN09132.1 prephenate dehydratase [Clostridiales bacterium]